MNTSRPKSKKALQAGQLFYDDGYGLIVEKNRGPPCQLVGFPFRQDVARLGGHYRSEKKRNRSPLFLADDDDRWFDRTPPTRVERKGIRNERGTVRRQREGKKENPTTRIGDVENDPAHSANQIHIPNHSTRINPGRYLPLFNRSGHSNRSSTVCPAVRPPHSTHVGSKQEVWQDPTSSLLADVKRRTSPPSG